MGKTFVCSLCRNGIIGGGLYIDEQSITYSTHSQRDQYKQCADNKKNHVSSTFAHAFMYGRKLD